MPKLVVVLEEKKSKSAYKLHKKALFMFIKQLISYLKPNVKYVIEYTTEKLDDNFFNEYASFKCIRYVFHIDELKTDKDKNLEFIFGKPVLFIIPNENIGSSKDIIIEK